MKLFVIGCCYFVFVITVLHDAHAFCPRPPVRQILTLSSSPSSLRATIDGCSVEFIDPKTGCQVVLLGCFHGSQSSAADVEACLKDASSSKEQNTVVALELCAIRFADLRRQTIIGDQSQQQQGEEAQRQQQQQRRPWLLRYAEMLKKTMEQSGLSTAAAAAVLGGVSGFQTALSGLEPGLEFKTALRIATEEKYDIVLADQTVDETLRKIGSLPQISLSMIMESLRHFSWSDTYGREAHALSTALLGIKDETLSSLESVTLWTFLTRSEDALRDVARLLVPPFLVLQAVVLFLNGGSDSVDSMHNMDSFITSLVLNTSLLGVGFISVALPAVRVVLRERDDILARGIQAACHQATEGGKGRVVAVLGLLHVNGVAQRMLRTTNKSKALVGVEQ